MRLTEEITARIDNLYKLQMASKLLEHGIKKNLDQWSAYKPTNFIYSYFTFNSIYTIDWSKTLKTGRVREWSNIQGPDRISETDRISSYIDFVIRVDDINLLEVLSDSIKKTIGDLDVYIEELNQIEIDSSITNTKKGIFIENIKHVFNDSRSLIDEQLIDRLKEIVRFIYLVRNNIFHGRKSNLNMMDQHQQKRLEFYAAILIGVNELLFCAVETMDWNRREENSYVNTNELRTRGLNNINRPNNSNRPNNQTLKQLFSLELPKGPLFYPFCGKDTQAPMKLFLDSIHEYHFSDIHEISLPIGFNNMKDIKRIIRLDRKEQLVQRDSLSMLSDNIQVPNEAARYEVVSDRSDINIHCHIQDGILALHDIEEISVFYYCGDSLGEGGSGQIWLDSKLLLFVLDKLVDGGIIITDGSNILKDNNVPWKNYWNNENPGDFVFADRDFKLIGEIEIPRRSRKMLAWQVKSI